MLAGKTLMAAGDSTGAEQYFKQVIQIDPKIFEAYTSLGNIYLNGQRLDEAKQQFESVARGEPTAEVAAETMIGIILELKNQPDEARRRYEKALQLDQRAPVAANNLAWNYANGGGNLDLALQLAQTAKTQMPNNPEVSDTLGWVYYKKGLTPSAITALREGLSQDKKSPALHYHLGLAYAQNGDKQEARESLEEALRLDPHFADAEDAKRVLASLKG
jgi:Flp pilus assembly protein TadD